MYAVHILYTNVNTVQYVVSLVTQVISSIEDTVQQIHKNTFFWNFELADSFEFEACWNYAGCGRFYF